MKLKPFTFLYWGDTCKKGWRFTHVDFAFPADISGFFFCKKPSVDITSANYMEGENSVLWQIWFHPFAWGTFTQCQEDNIINTLLEEEVSDNGELLLRVEENSGEDTSNQVDYIRSDCSIGRRAIGPSRCSCLSLILNYFPPPTAPNLILSH